MAAELEQEQTEGRSPRSILAIGCVAFPVTAMLLFTVIYLLGGWTLIPPVDRHSGRRSGLLTARVEDGEQILAVLTLAGLLFFIGVQFLKAMRAKSWVDASLMFLIGLTAVLLIFDVILVTNIPALRPLALMVIGVAIGVLLGPKFWHRRPGQSK